MFGHSSLRGNELRRKVYLASFCQCFTRDLFMQNPLSCFIPIKRHCSDHSQSLIKSRVLVIASKTARDFDQVVWPWFWKEAFWRNMVGDKIVRRMFLTRPDLMLRHRDAAQIATYAQVTAHSATATIQQGPRPSRFASRQVLLVRRD